MLKKFYAKCIQSDPLGRLIVGQVYECEAWQGKTLIHGACIMDSKTFWEHFEPTTNSILMAYENYPALTF